MGCLTTRYYDQVRDYLNPQLHCFIKYYKNGDLIDLPPYHGCGKKNKNVTKKMIEYNQGNQCVCSTNKKYWRNTKDKYKIEKKRFYWRRYMTWTNRRHMFKNKGDFVYDYKLKKFKHMSKTPMFNDYNYLQRVRKYFLENVSK